MVTIFYCMTTRPHSSVVLTLLIVTYFLLRQVSSLARAPGEELDARRSTVGADERVELAGGVPSSRHQGFVHRSRPQLLVAFRQWEQRQSCSPDRTTLEISWHTWFNSPRAPRLMRGTRMLSHMIEEEREGLFETPSG
jgi:hypothetical protein